MGEQSDHMIAMTARSFFDINDGAIRKAKNDRRRPDTKQAFLEEVQNVGGIGFDHVGVLDPNDIAFEIFFRTAADAAFFKLRWM